MANILLIEDNAGVLESTQELLQLEGFSVHTASNGQEGFLKIEQLLPDIIISDILMPLMDGLQLLSEVARYPKLNTIPFIFLSAKSEKTDVRVGLDLGADDYLVKPFEIDDLLKSIKGCLERKKSLNLKYPSNKELIQRISHSRKTLERALAE